MNQIAPEEWLVRLNYINDIPLRNAVAKIVWWDFFGVKKCNRRWNHLDDFLKTPSEDIEDNLLLLGLRSVGYSDKEATMRIFPENRLHKNNQTQPTEI